MVRAGCAVPAVHPARGARGIQTTHAGAGQRIRVLGVYRVLVLLLGIVLPAATATRYAFASVVVTRLVAMVRIMSMEIVIAAVIGVK